MALHLSLPYLIDKGKRAVKVIGDGVGELFGGRGAEAKTKEQAIIELELEIYELQLQEMLEGLDQSKAITSKQNLLDYYKQLK